MQNEQKIPRIVHWCWLSGEPVPAFLQACMASWQRRLKGYTFKCWTQENFDIHAVRWVEEAVSERKWAFAADYIRLYALHTEGGIYLDSDVELLRSFDDMRRYDFFSAAEYCPIFYKYNELDRYVDREGLPRDREAFVPAYGIQAAVMGAAKGCTFVRACMDFYETNHFREPDGRLRSDLTMPLVIAKIAERYGFRYRPRETQTLLTHEGERLYLGSSVLLPSNIRLLRFRTRAVHHCAGSWLAPEKRSEQRTIGCRRIPLILKYGTKGLWSRLRKWRRNTSARIASKRTKTERP